MSKVIIEDSEVKDCPKGFPEGFFEWVRKDVLTADNVIIYKKGNLKGKCYSCGRNVVADRYNKFIQHRVVRCPSCHMVVQCIYEESDVWKKKKVENVAALYKGKNGDIWIRQFILKRDPEVKYKKLREYLSEASRYLLRGDKIAVWEHYHKDTFYYRVDERELPGWERIRSFHIYDGCCKIFPGDFKSIFSDCKLKYSDFDKFMENHSGAEGIKYLNNFIKYPIIEFLFKAGYEGILKEKLNFPTREQNNILYWKRKTVKECFKIPLSYLSLLPKAEWSLEKLSRVQKLIEDNFSPKEIQLMLKADIRDIVRASRLRKYCKINKLINYINKQYEAEKAKYSQAWYSIDGALRDYEDYLRECTLLKLDTKSKEILFPKNLIEGHRRTSAMYLVERDNIRAENFSRVSEKWSVLNFEKGNLLIRAARSAVELKDEGRALHHCVGGYAEKMSEDKTVIFFVRKKEAAETPFYTLELCKNELVQCRTENNKSYECDENVKSFITQWLKLVKKQNVV